MQIEKEVNEHFEEYLFDWNYKYYFLVGGYGSSKSYNTALKIILKLLKEKRKALVVREVYDTMKESCFDLLCEIIEDLDLGNFIKTYKTPMSIVFKNGSRIIFKGLDKAWKLKSINDVSIIWLEECSEIKYASFKELVGRLRHSTLSLHMLLTTNPIAKSNWCYKHFFIYRKINDIELYRDRIIITEDTYYHHSTADDNLFLPKSYIDELDKIKEYDIDLYRIARRGRFGVNGILVLPQFEIWKHDLVMEKVNALRMIKRTGFDFGFEVSYNAVLRLAIDKANKILYLYFEYYKNKMTDNNTADELIELGFTETKELIIGDCAEPKTIEYFKQRGLNIRGCEKFSGSRLANTKKVKRLTKIVCSDKCIHCIDELQDLTYKLNRDGEIIPDEFNIDPHLFSAIWYALDGIDITDLKQNLHLVKNEINQANNW